MSGKSTPLWPLTTPILWQNLPCLIVKKLNGQTNTVGLVLSMPTMTVSGTDGYLSQHQSVYVLRRPEIQRNAAGG